MSIPVIVAGRILELATAAEMGRHGDADIVGMTRALIADPALARKSRGGQAAAVRACFGNNECHYGRPVTCAINADAGREVELTLRPASRTKPPLVTADVLAARGHSVRLLSELLHVGADLEPATLYSLPRRLPDRHVVIENLTALAAVEATSVRLRNTISGAERVIDDVDTIVSTSARRPRDALATELRSTGGTVHRIGDCLAPRRLLHATMDGAGKSGWSTQERKMRNRSPSSHSTCAVPWTTVPGNAGCVAWVVHSPTSRAPRAARLVAWVVMADPS